MTDSVRILPEAHVEIAGAYAWYEEHRPGLGDEFLLALEAVLELLRRAPLAFPETYRNGRKARLRRFPYVVIYLVEDGVVTIVSMHHTSRNPARWRRRL